MNKFEKVWVSIFTLLILGATIKFSMMYTDYSSTESILLNWVVSPISAITGIICVVLAAKGKINTFFWGIVNCITYGYIAYKGGVYGDAIINIFYFLPLQFLGLTIWKKKMKNDGMVSSSLIKYPIRTIIGALVTWVAFSKLLENTDHFLSSAMKKSSTFYGAMPKGWGVFMDSFTEIGQFFGQWLLTIAKAEQWIFWILVNVVSIIMWGFIIKADPTSLAYAVPTMIMWIGYLVNSIYGLILWVKRAKGGVDN
jgi:nicotinamide mononucleotide transporter